MKTITSQKGSLSDLYKNEKVLNYLKGGNLNNSSGGRLYKFGGKTYEHGGAHGNEDSSDIKLVAKDSYNTADEARPGTDYIYMVDGQPTTYNHADVANLLRSEGLQGQNLKMRMEELFSAIPDKTKEDPKDERAYRQGQLNKILADVGAVARGDGSQVKMVGSGKFVREDLGNALRGVYRGDRAMQRDIAPMGERQSPGQSAFGEGVNADEFLKSLSRNYRN